MDNSKLKDKKHKLVVDNCSGKRDLAPGAKPPAKRRTPTHQCHSNETQFQVLINLIMSHITKHWYLSSVGKLYHEFHTALDEEHQKIARESATKTISISCTSCKVLILCPPPLQKSSLKGQSGQFLAKPLNIASVKHETPWLVSKESTRTGPLQRD